MKKPVDLRKKSGLFGSRGSVLVVAAVFILVIIGMAALAIDIGVNTASKAQQENVSAAAVLACQSGLSTMNLTENTKFKKFSSAYKKAIEYARYNKVMGTSANLTYNDNDNVSNILIGKWYGSGTSSKFSPFNNALTNYTTPNACKVIVPRATARSIFSRAIFRNYSSRITSRAVATFGASTAKPINLEIVQDITYSFNAQVKLNGPANQADDALAKCIQDKRATGSKFGLTTFDLGVAAPSATATTASIKSLTTTDATPVTATMVSSATGYGDPAPASGSGMKQMLAAMRTVTCNTTVNNDPKCTNTQAGIVAATSVIDKSLFPGMTTDAQIKTETDKGLQDYALFISTDGVANQVLTSPKTSTSSSDYTNAKIVAYVAAEKTAGRWPNDAPTPTGAPTWSSTAQTFTDNFYDYWTKYWSAYCSGTAITAATVSSAQHDSVAQACAVKAAKAACDKGYKIYASYYSGSQDPNAVQVKQYTCGNHTTTDSTETKYFFKPTSPTDLTTKAGLICLNTPTLVEQR